MHVRGILFVAALAIAASCSGDDGGGDVSESTVAPTTVAPATTAVPETTTPPETTTSPETTEPPIEVGIWSEIAPGGDCACADGSEFVFWDRPADPDRVMLFFQGGGACFDATTCAFEGGTYTSDVGPPPEVFDGVFDADNPDNPLGGWSTVYVPYCTGDVHLGTAVADYDGLEVNHLGHVNAMAAMDFVTENYTGATEIVVTGISAGSIPSPFYAAMLRDRFPGTSITVLADGSGGYAQGTSVASGVGDGWGVEAALPAWPSAQDVPLSDWSIPGLFVRAAAHAPDVTYARIDFAYDSVQEFFLSLTGAATEDLLAEIDANDAWIEEQAGIEFHSYTAPGALHTVLLAPFFYETEVAGVRLSDWVADVIAGTATDVRCEVCDR